LGFDRDTLSNTDPLPEPSGRVGTGRVRRFAEVGFSSKRAHTDSPERRMLTRNGLGIAERIPAARIDSKN
jgi:hypothetical protein